MKHINLEPMAAHIMAPKERKMTPKMFAYQLTQRCLQNPQHIVLPEVRGLQRSASCGIDVIALVCLCKFSCCNQQSASVQMFNACRSDFSRFGEACCTLAH